MCLYLKSSKVRIAKEDIICYKFLVKEVGSYFTPYQSSLIEVGKLIEDTESLMIEKTSKRDFNFILYGGMFHTFKDIEAARKDVRWFANNMSRVNEYVIFKCIIPKGTEYYEGTFEAYKCYASKKLIISEVVV